MSQPAFSLLIFFSSVLVIMAIWKFRLIAYFTNTGLSIKDRIKEDVLKAVYQVTANNRSVGIDGLSGALKISSKRLLGNIQEMAENQLIKIDGENLILTLAGEKKALEIIRRHRLWETYLSERTGINKSEWHALAEKKEHQLTAEDTARLYHELGNPRYDPHGDPIPTETGEMAPKTYTSLSSFEIDVPAKIVHIEDEPEVIYKQIIDQNLFIGCHLKIHSTDNHSVRFHCEGNDYELSPIVASNISVRPLTDKDAFEEGKVRLSSLEPGERAKVVGITSECRGPNRRRLLDLGFVSGTTISTEMNGPLNDPKAYKVRNTLIALRKDQADFILIEKE